MSSKFHKGLTAKLRKKKKNKEENSAELRKKKEWMRNPTASQLKISKASLYSGFHTVLPKQGQFQVKDFEFYLKGFRTPSFSEDLMP